MRELELVADDVADTQSSNGTRPSADRFTLIGFEELLAQPDLAWLIDGLVPLDGMSVIFGAPGSFKSFVALDWALCVATGLPWFGRTVKPGWIVYVAAEGRGGLKQRVLAWWEAHDRPDMSRARFLPEAVNLLDRSQIERAKRTLASLPERPRLLTVDTMARSMVGGDENAARDVGLFIAAVDGLRSADAAHVVHHAGKDGKDERGSSALRGAADLMVKTRREGNSPRLTLACDKAKDFEPWDDLTMQRELVGSSCVLCLVEASEARDELCERVLAYVVGHGPVSQNAVEKAVPGRAARVREALTSLDRNNRIRQTGKGWQVVRPDFADAPGRTASEAPDAECVPDGGKGTTSLPVGTHLVPASRHARPDTTDAPSLSTPRTATPASREEKR
jgi:hypothetical protein